jgi:hypothetical protein
MPYWLCQYLPWVGEKGERSRPAATGSGRPNQLLQYLLVSSMDAVKRADRYTGGLIRYGQSE